MPPALPICSARSAISASPLAASLPATAPMRPAQRASWSKNFRCTNRGNKMHETRRQEIADIDTTIAELQALARYGACFDADIRIHELRARRAYLVKAA